MTVTYFLACCVFALPIMRKNIRVSHDVCDKTKTSKSTALSFNVVYQLFCSPKFTLCKCVRNLFKIRCNKLCYVLYHGFMVSRFHSCKFSPGSILFPCHFVFYFENLSPFYLFTSNFTNIYCQNIEVLKELETVKQLGNILKTNVSTCKSVGHPFVNQLGRIYLDMVNVYKVLSENISAAVAQHGMFPLFLYLCA